MQKSKKVILSILLIAFFVVAIIAFVLSTKVTEEEKPTKNHIEEKDRFGLVDDYKEFFAIQSAVNDIANVEMDTSYFVKEVYIKTISKTYYYFIKCIKFAEFDGPVDKYLLLVLDKDTNSYELSEINDKVDNLKQYATEYNVIPRDINSSYELRNGNDSEQNILTIYLEYFKILLIKDPYAAYNMLYQDTKSKYVDYNDFNSNTINIYEKLSSGIFSIGVDEENEIGGKIYSFEDDNRNKIQIFEESIMNFKISY